MFELVATFNKWEFSKTMKTTFTKDQIKVLLKVLHGIVIGDNSTETEKEMQISFVSLINK